MTTLAIVRRRLDELANPSDAANLQRFFRTGPGEYGEGDRFLGIRVPVLRRLARESDGLALAELSELLDSPWHEARHLALMLLVRAYQRGDESDWRAVYTLYLASTARINNWDLVDVSAPYIVGRHLRERSRAPLRKLARSGSLWERRIAIVATFDFIRQRDFDDSIALAEMLLDDRHDLIHKAVGWMLREIGNRDQPVLERFLAKHAHRMPRTMLRYSIEKFTPKRREYYMEAKARTT